MQRPLPSFPLHTNTLAVKCARTHTQTDGEKEGELGFLSNPQTLTQILTDLHLQMLPNILSLTRGGTNALETNYQSGVSLYSYLGQ